MDIFLTLSYSELSWFLLQKMHFVVHAFLALKRPAAVDVSLGSGFKLFFFSLLSLVVFMPKPLAAMAILSSASTSICKKLISLVNQSLATFSPADVEDGCLCQTLSNSSGSEASTKGYSIAAHISVVT